MFLRFSTGLTALVFLCASSAVAAEARDVLTLNTAIDRALAHAPQIQSADASLRANEGTALQASALPNPTLQAGAENFGGQNGYKGINTAEFTLGVSQLIELGGKRGARQEVAKQRVALGQFDAAAARLDMIRDTTMAYMAVASAQEGQQLAEEQEVLARQLLKEVSRRVDAAAVPLMQKTKTEVTVANAQLVRARTARDFAQSQFALAALTGEPSEAVRVDAQQLYQLEPPPSHAAIEAKIDQNPDILRWGVEKARSEASLELERANAVPDPTLNFGVRELRGQGGSGFGNEDSRAFVAGFTIPIPVFDANQGNIDRARHEVSKAQSDAAVAAMTLRTNAHQYYQEMLNAYAEAQSLRDHILPTSETAYKQARAGYGLGRFPYLEVLDAQRTLFVARAQYLGALRDYHTAKAQLARLTVSSLPLSSKEPLPPQTVPDPAPQENQPAQTEHSEAPHEGGTP